VAIQSHTLDQIVASPSLLTRKFAVRRRTPSRPHGRASEHASEGRSYDLRTNGRKADGKCDPYRKRPDLSADWRGQTGQGSVSGSLLYPI
jgi:hypothetical protein